MKCRDCVHYELCVEQEAILGEKTIDEIKGVEKLCEYFKPKSHFVEVVRCKDCARVDHCFPIASYNEEPIEGWYCERHKEWMNPGDYCSDGERLKV